MRYEPSAAVKALKPRAGQKRFVIGQLGQTLDGRIATPTGKSLYINGTCALAHLHRLRAAVDAVVVGAETMLADDPRLTVRHAPGRTPTRVIVDPNGRVPVSARCMADGAGRVIVVRREGAEGAAPMSDQVTVLALPTDDAGMIAPQALLDALAERGMPRVLIEGGPRTLALALQADVIDELHVMVAPKIFGSGIPGITLPPIDELSEGLQPRATTRLFPDGDVLFICDMRARACQTAESDAEAVAPFAALRA